MTVTTKADAINGAMSIADDVAQGRLGPATLEAQAVAELRELFGQVIGPGDPIWETQADVARQAIALGALTADELNEWAAVMRHRAGEPVSQHEPDQTPPEPVSLPTAALSAETEPVTETAAEAEPVPGLTLVPDPAPAPVVTPPVRADGYDPLRGWNPGGTRRR